MNILGAAVVYAWNGSAWNQLGDSFIGKRFEDRLGEMVSLNNQGDIISILSVYGDRVQVYKYDGSVWEQLGSGIAGGAYSGDALDDILDAKLSSDGTIVALSWPWRDAYTTSGVVRLYHYDGTDWVKLGSDLENDVATTFGSHLKLSADGETVAIVTANGNNPEDAKVNVFHFNNTAQPTASPTAPTLNPTDVPTTSPTMEPSDKPTMDPTISPTDVPTCAENTAGSGYFIL